MCGLEEETHVLSKFKRINHYGSSNATPECGFSINGKLLDTHGYSTAEHTRVAIHCVKDNIHRIWRCNKNEHFQRTFRSL